MSRGKYASPGVTMGDVASWREALKEACAVRTRIVWSSGATDGSWRVTAQALLVEEGQAKVVSEVYDVWPRRGVSSPEAMMLQLVAALDNQLQPLVGVQREAGDEP